MSIKCGIQCLVCDYPIHLDTYKGCSHACKYCFVKQKYSINNIEPIHTVKSLRNFIEGKRNFETKWCDWNIPIHWGATSDPFQVCEKTHKCTLKCLEVFAETKYPFIVSTKNPVLATEEPYLSLLSQCDVVFQISMACDKYDKLELGAPTYQERLKAAKILSQHVTRLIVRVQPFFADKFKDILAEIPHYAECGAYGIIVEGYSTAKKQKGLVKDGKYCFPIEILVPMFKRLKEECHKYGLRFFSGEDRLRFLGDSLSCCGTEGLETFKPNKFNIEHLAHDMEYVAPTEAMQATDTYQPFKCIGQTQVWAMKCKDKSFEQLMHEVGDPYVYWYQELRQKWSD